MHRIPSSFTTSANQDQAKLGPALNWMLNKLMHSSGTAPVTVMLLEPTSKPNHWSKARMHWSVGAAAITTQYSIPVQMLLS